MGKKMEGWAGAPSSHGMEEKLSSPPPTLGSDASARLLCTLRRDPWGSEPSRALHRHRGGPNLKNAPALTPGRGLHSVTATASPRGKKIEGWAGTPAPMAGRKIEFPPPTLGSACRARLLCTLRRDPSGSESLPCFASSSGWPEFENAPSLTQGRG